MNTITIMYVCVCLVIPILYLLVYSSSNIKKKNYGKAVFNSVIMFLLLFSIKYIFMIDIRIFDKPNCLLNNNCTNTKNNIDNDITTTKTTTTSSTTTVTTTTVKVNDTKNEYAKVSETMGTKSNIRYSSKGYEIYEIDGITYVDGYLVANKSYFLPEDYAPSDTYSKASPTATSQCATCINNLAYKAWKDMKADAAALGLNLYISSGYRSYITQRNIYNRNVSKNGQQKADTYSARPGSSEHQTGLCFDLNTIDASFARTNEGKWVNDNAYKYGYIIRYPDGKTEETGYIYESWHLRYVGTDLAYKLYNNGNWLSMEDYFGITSKYED